jgi:ribosomal protein S8
MGYLSCIIFIWIYSWYGNTIFWKAQTHCCCVTSQNEYTSYTTFTRISSPKKRVYTSVHELRASMHSFHVRVLSTPKGIMADKDAIKENVGGEVLFICN